uniref:RNA polymerase sigma factor n=2 Tax=Oryza rufipogon TaxID=4529 RepID=A0A0E0QG65_ORYRU
MNSGGRSLLSSPLFASSSPAFRGGAAAASCSSSSSPSSSSRATVVPMVHDTGGGRASSTACHYSPSLVAAEPEEHVHGRSKDDDDDAAVSLMGEKALLELLLDMALEQHAPGKKLPAEEREESEFDIYLRDDKSHVLYHPEFSSTSVSSSPLSVKSSERSDLGTASAVLTKDVALLAEETDILATQLKASQLYSVDSSKSNEELQSKGQVFVRSTRLLERRSKRRYAPRASIADVSCSADNSKKKEKSKKYGRVLEPDEPFKLFLRDRETTEFLTAKEERHLFSKIQAKPYFYPVIFIFRTAQILMKIEEAHRKLEVQCGREPTLAEWAEAVGMSSKELQSSIRTGRRCREKMARSNFRLVIHVARKYEGYGLDIQDLVQDGCSGLMKTFEKFNPSKGCRFPTYAYWWIRQSIKKSIFKNSRLIRLPESVYALLRKVGKARMECIMEGEQPTNANVARRAGITIEKLAKLRAKTRKPRSMQDHVWSDEGVTFQVRDFLGILSPREKEIIEHRFGIHDGEPKTLHVIGDMFGLSKERIRQLQNRALEKLKRSASLQGFDVYFDLLT